MFNLTGDLTGRILAINTMKTKRFACGGFSVNVHNPSAVVGTNAQHDQIRMALVDGRLLDITDQNNEGLDLRGARHTKPVLEDTGEKVFITVGLNGAMSIAIPKDKEELEQFEHKIEEQGVLILENAQVASQLSPLIYGKLEPGHTNKVVEQFHIGIDNIKRHK